MVKRWLEISVMENELVRVIANGDVVSEGRSFSDVLNALSDFFGVKLMAETKPGEKS